jgi:hypothetical protein
LFYLLTNNEQFSYPFSDHKSLKIDIEHKQMLVETGQFSSNSIDPSDNTLLEDSEVTIFFLYNPYSTLIIGNR